MKVLTDLHVHTVASGHAYSTVEENIRAAAAKGLELIAITDHGPAMADGTHEYYFANLRVLPRRFCGVEVLRGIEANVMDGEGKLDLREMYLERLDIVLAGFHPYCLPPGDRDWNTRAMIKALENPFVDIIVHPGNPMYAVHYDEVARAAAALGKALEINNSSFSIRPGSDEGCLRIAEAALRHGCLLVAGSDAHFSQEVGEFPDAFLLMEKAGVTEEHILNTTAKKVREFLCARGKKHFCESGL